jgi:kynurenine formamidase
MRLDVFEALAEKVRTWGRWDSAAQRGTLNHISPKAMKRAAATVTSGKAFSLGLRFDSDGPQDGTYRFNPHLYVTSLDQSLSSDRPRSRVNDDVIHMPSQAATQWDALAHVHYDGMSYDGCRIADTLSTSGATCNGIEHLAAPGIMSRGILLDIARYKGVDILPTTYAVTVDDLRAAAQQQGVLVEAGDIVVVRTGHIRRFTQEGDRVAFNGPQPGLSGECAEWLFDMSVAAVAADNVAVECLDDETIHGEMPLPLHMLCLRDMGMPLGEMFDLEALAADCAADGRYSFLLSAPPLAITGGFGSPVNPMVLK